jgi:glycosyltransferase involved in cell wall biosynthesis
VVLYVGTLHRDRLDVDLCAALASALGDFARFVLVGPVALDAGDQARLADAGAVLLGAREHTAVPGYLKNADVLVIPHLVTGFTDSLDPIKVYEYLAAARPVVCTPVAGVRELDGDTVNVVSATAFVEAVTLVLAEPPAARPAPAVATWDERAAAMLRIVNEVSAS